MGAEGQGEDEMGQEVMLVDDEPPTPVSQISSSETSKTKKKWGFAKKDKSKNQSKVVLIPQEDDKQNRIILAQDKNKESLALFDRFMETGEERDAKNAFELAVASNKLIKEKECTTFESKLLERKAAKGVKLMLKSRDLRRKENVFGPPAVKFKAEKRDAEDDTVRSDVPELQLVNEDIYNGPAKAGAKEAEEAKQLLQEILPEIHAEKQGIKTKLLSPLNIAPLSEAPDDDDPIMAQRSPARKKQASNGTIAAAAVAGATGIASFKVQNPDELSTLGFDNTFEDRTLEVKSHGAEPSQFDDERDVSPISVSSLNALMDGPMPNTSPPKETNVDGDEHIEPAQMPEAAAAAIAADEKTKSEKKSGLLSRLSPRKKVSVAAGGVAAGGVAAGAAGVGVVAVAATSTKDKKGKSGATMERSHSTGMLLPLKKRMAGAKIGDDDDDSATNVEREMAAADVAAKTNAKLDEALKQPSHLTSFHESDAAAAKLYQPTSSAVQMSGGGPKMVTAPALKDDIVRAMSWESLASGESNLADVVKEAEKLVKQEKSMEQQAATELKRLESREGPKKNGKRGFFKRFGKRGEADDKDKSRSGAVVGAAVAGAAGAAALNGVRGDANSEEASDKSSEPNITIETGGEAKDPNDTVKEKDEEIRPPATEEDIKGARATTLPHGLRNVLSADMQAEAPEGIDDVMVAAVEVGEDGNVVSETTVVGKDKLIDAITAPRQVSSSPAATSMLKTLSMSSVLGTSESFDNDLEKAKKEQKEQQRLEQEEKETEEKSAKKKPFFRKPAFMKRKSKNEMKAPQGEPEVNDDIDTENESSSQSPGPADNANYPTALTGPIRSAENTLYSA